MQQKLAPRRAQQETTRRHRPRHSRRGSCTSDALVAKYRKYAWKHVNSAVYAGPGRVDHAGGEHSRDRNAASVHVALRTRT